MDEGCGNSHRFTCPYHAWSYNGHGDLIGIYAPKDFGEIDKSQYGLTELPCLEKAGLIWVTINPKSTLDIELFLSGYDELLEHFGFDKWHHFASQVVEGPNWKIAYDGYLDLYHLPILHKDTFGPDFPNQAIYYSWGPHQRVAGPMKGMAEMLGESEEKWPTEQLTAGVWTIFPHVSIAGFDGGGRAVERRDPSRKLLGREREEHAVRDDRERNQRPEHRGPRPDGGVAPHHRPRGDVRLLVRHIPDNKTKQTTKPTDNESWRTNFQRSDLISTQLQRTESAAASGKAEAKRVM